MPGDSSRLKLDALLGEEHRLETEDHLYRARNGILNFTVYTKPDYEINWHHKLTCKYLNRFVRGEIKRLMIFEPPRHGKSELTSRRLPAYIFGHRPKASIIGTSHTATLASQMNRDVQRIIGSERYHELFPSTMLAGDPGAVVKGGTNYLQNSDMFEIVGHGGMYRSAGVGGAIVGMGGDYLLIDDPIKNQEEADSAVYRDKLWEWYNSTLYTRLEKDGAILLTHTRWHEDDLAGRLLKLAEENPAADQWTVLNLPAICENKNNPEDPREIGDPLWSNKYSPERLAGMKATLGSRIWNAQYQQRPAPEGGAIVHREWWNFYDELPTDFDTIVQSWDLTFTDSKTSDFVVGVVWGKKGADYFLLDMVRERMSFTETIAAIQRLSNKWPQAEAKYVEQAANGFALIDMLKSKISGLIAVKPTGSKIARANAVSPRIESGNVYLPSPSRAPWIDDVLEEWASFPMGAHDDIVDAMCHGLMKLGEMTSNDWLPVSITGVNVWKY